MPEDDAETTRERTERVRETYLRFVSSELTSHAANLIGLSIILFAFLRVVTSYFPDRVPTTISSVSPYTLVFLLFWIVSTGIFYAFMRLVYYGQIADFTIAHPFEHVTMLPQLCQELERKLLSRIMFRLFRKGISHRSLGFYLSIAVGFIVSLFFFITFIWQWSPLIFPKRF